MIVITLMTPKQDINLWLVVSLWLARTTLPQYVEVVSVEYK
jgi:hypothetical protein